MNGYGHFLAAHLWFRSYWACFALLLMVLAAMYWPRGTALEWKERTRVARQRFRMPARVLAVVSVVGFAGIGAWIGHNTNITNQYVPSDLARHRRADYEKQYRQYKDLPQPRIADVKVDVDIYPSARKSRCPRPLPIGEQDHDAHQRLRTCCCRPTSSCMSVQFAAARHRQRRQDPGLYHLSPEATALALARLMDFDWAIQYWSKGFRNAPSDTQVVANGTFINNLAFPHFGYNEGNQLVDRNYRRKYGLGPVPRMAKIDDQPARMNNLICCDSDWVNFEATVSTEADQIALAPGYLEREWTEQGRHYFHYKMDKPILIFSFQSARYQVKRDKWKDVSVEVYYDAKHPLQRRSHDRGHQEVAGAFLGGLRAISISADAHIRVPRLRGLCTKLRQYRAVLESIASSPTCAIRTTSTMCSM